MKKVAQVLWSGGLDSTYMIYKLLQEHYHVDAYYVKIGNNPAKTKRELLAIRKLSKLFTEYDFEYTGILTEFTINISKNNELKYSQPPIWLFSAYYLTGPVFIGYVMNDDSISYIDDYRKIVKNLNKLRLTPLQIEFPLSKISKVEILLTLPKKFLNNITYCESEEKDNCAMCSSCLTHTLALNKKALLEKEIITK